MPWRRASQTQEGKTALHVAACYGAADVIDELVRRGSNVNATDFSVRSHLSLARQPGTAPRHDTSLALAPSLYIKVPVRWIKRYVTHAPTPRRRLLRTACADRAAVRSSPVQPPLTLPRSTATIWRAGSHPAALGGEQQLGGDQQEDRRGQATRAPRRRPQREVEGAPAPILASRAARSVAYVARAHCSGASPPVTFVCTHFTQPLSPAWRCRLCTAQLAGSARATEDRTWECVCLAAVRHTRVIHAIEDALTRAQRGREPASTPATNTA